MVHTLRMKDGYDFDGTLLFVQVLPDAPPVAAGTSPANLS